MRNIRVIQKYNLPFEVKLKIEKTPEGGFFIKFPEFPGLLTQAQDWQELLYTVTDAILTHFEVPRKIAKQFSVYYLPPLEPLSQKEETINKAILFHALTSAEHSYEYSGLRN